MQVAVAVDPAGSRHWLVGLDPGEERRALLQHRPGGQPAPRGRLREALVLGGAREAEAPPQLAGGAGISGDASSATMRSASRQSPSTAATAVGVTRLVERPRRAVLDVRVRRPDEVPHRAEAPGVVELVQARGERVERGRGRLDQRTVGARVGHDAAAVVDRHVEHAVGEVAEVVGEVGVVARHHRLVAEVAVGPEALVGEEVVAEPVDAEVGDEVGGRDLVELASCSSSRRRRAGSRARTRTAAAPPRRPSASRASRRRAGGGCPCR